MKSNRVIHKLISRSMASNRTRNIAAIVAIALTSIMFTTVFTVSASMLYSASLTGAGTVSGQGIVTAAAVLAMILGSGYLIIYNIFQISVTRDIQFYGRLKTLGATSRQIRRILFAQVMRICAIGIPAGLAIGYGIGAGLIPVVMVSLGSSAALPMHPAIFIAAAAFSMLTVMLSCSKPAKTASKVAPVEAVKYVNVRPPQKPRRKYGRTTPRSMAKNNLRQNRKRTALVVLSIAIGLALMNSFYVYQHSFDEAAYVAGFIQSDIAITGALPPEVRGHLTEMPGVVRQGSIWYTESKQPINPEVQARLIAYYEEEDSGQKGWLESDENASRQYQELKRTGTANVSIYGMETFPAGMGEVYLGAFDAEQFETGGYVLAYGIMDNGDGSVHYEIGDMIELQGKRYELMALIDPPKTLADGLRSNQNELEITYVISAGAFHDSFGPMHAAGAFLDTTDLKSSDALVSAIQSEYPELTVESRRTYTARFQSQTLAVSVMGYALGLIMAVIGILNFANTMLTAIIARRHEFTMLESIGMTTAQLKTMLVFEGLRYIGYAVAMGIIGAALIASTYIQEAVSTSWVASYNFSLAPFAIIVPILLALALAVPILCFRETQRESLTERLRNQ